MSIKIITTSVQTQRYHKNRLCDTTFGELQQFVQ